MKKLRELMGLLDEIEKYSSYSGVVHDDHEAKSSAANAAFRDGLLKFTEEHAGTLRYSFPELSQRIQIQTSPDQSLRVYSWDTLDGGTMHFYDNVYQFHGVGGVFSKGSYGEEGDPGSFVNGVANVETKKGTVYLVSSTSVFSTMERAQAISAYQVDGNSLSDGVKIFKTAEGLTNSIGFAYNFFSVVDREDRPIRLFEYDSKTKTVSFPVVIDDEEMPTGRVTTSKIVYRYNGEYFVRVKN